MVLLFHRTGNLGFFTSKANALGLVTLLLVERGLLGIPALHPLPFYFFAGCALVVSSPLLLLWSQRPFHPLYSPLREVVLANASHLNRSWASYASKLFLKQSTQMSYGPWKLRESRGSMQFICALLPQNLFSLLYLLVKGWWVSFRFPSCRLQRFWLPSFI